MLASSAINELKKRSNKSQAVLAQRFFKIAKGEYGYGDVFIGVRVPVIRQIARKYQLLTLSEIEKLTSSKLHEVRLCGLVIITMQYKRAKGEAAQKRLFDFYLKQIKKGRVNNWDLVDVTAPIMGGYLIPRSDSMQLLKKLAKSKDLWQRRSGEGAWQVASDAPSPRILRHCASHYGSDGRPHHRGGIGQPATLHPCR